MKNKTTNFTTHAHSTNEKSITRFGFILFLCLVLILAAKITYAQTNPTAQTLPYSQNFGTATFTSMPAGMAAWTAGANRTTQAAAEGAAPAADATITTATASTTTGGIYGYAASSNARVYIQESSNATNGTSTIALAVNAGSATAITVAYQLELINGGVTTQDFGLELQYRLGTTGAFTSVAGSAITFGAVTTYTPTTLSYNITGLTTSSVYQIRWITWRPSGTGGSKGVGIDNISVTAATIPTISLGLLTPGGSFTTTVGTPSAAQTFSLSGTNLTANLTVGAVSGYEYSIDGFATAGQSSLSFAPPTVSQTVSVRLTGASIGTFNGASAIASTGAAGSPASLTLNGTVNPTTPLITVGSLTPGTSFSTSTGTPSTTQTFSLSASNLSASLTVSAVAGYEYSDDGFATAGQSSLTYSTATLSKTISVRLTGASAGTFNGTITIASAGATGSPATISLNGTVTTQPSITEVILPQYMQGVNGTNSNRIPYACYLTINNLTANATYNYFPSVVISSDAATSNGAGNIIFANAGGFTRSTGGAFTAGNFSTFTASATGSYSGWFIIEPTGNATRFVPGNSVFIRIMLNDGAGGTTVVSRPTTTNSATVINLLASAGATNGTGLRGLSSATAKNFVVTYDNVGGTGRPISASFIESDGTANITTNSYAAFYGNNVEAVPGAYGVIIPNTNVNGIRRIEQRDITTGNVVGCVATDADGVWAGGANTVNPTGGATALVISSADAPLINVTPAVSISASPSTTICSGTNVTFTASVTNGGTTPTYQWRLNGNPVGTGLATYSNNSLSNGDVVTCDITSSDVCASPTTATSTPLTITVNPSVTPTITGTLSFCSSSSTTLDAGTGYVSYLWNTGETTEFITVTTAGSHSVTVSTGTCSGTSSTVATTILNIPSQPSGFTAGPAFVSANQTGVAYTVANDANATSYNWTYSGSGATITGTSNSATINFSSATAGTLSVTATNSCGTSTPLSMSIGVNPPSFGVGNLVVLQTNTTVSKSSSPITLKEITPTGGTGITVSIPSSSTNNYPFQTSGIYGGSEGFLSTSTDGKLLMLGGYATSATIADITATTAATTKRAVGTVNQSGFFSIVGTSNTFYNANDIRGAISDGTNYWASGASGTGDGIDYFGPGTQAGLGTAATPPKAYGLRIFNGNIYYATQKAGPSNTVSQLGIFQLGTGLPTSGTPTITQVINSGATVLPQDFSFNSAGDVCYIASGLLTSNGGVRKYTKSGSVWTYQYTLGTATQGAYGLVVDYSGANPVIYATTLEAGGNKVIKITDTGAGSAVTVLVPVVANVYNKGISFAPVDAGTPTVNLNISTNAGTEAGATAITVTAVASSPVLSTQTVSLNVTGTGITTGDYTLSNNTITIPAGATTGTVTFTVVDDILLETTETAVLTIGSPSAGIVLGATTSQAISIADNDNTAPTISMNVITTSDLVDGGAATSPSSPYTFSGTIADLTDPASTLGFDFAIFDNETVASGLIVTATSSNTSVVTNANLLFAGTGAIRNLKIIPTGVGYSNITVSVNDGVNTTNYVIAYAASNRTPDIAPVNTFWHTGLSDASDGIAIDDNYYLTGDDEFSYVNVYSRTASGAPAVVFDAGAYCALPDPGHPEIDIEAAARSTTNSSKMYWAGSMSNGASPFPAKPNRDRIFATTISGTGTSTVITFAGWAAVKSALLTWGDANGYSFTASAAVGVDSKSASGFALEGMAFGPDNTTLYLGLRAPLVPTSTRTNAVIAPLLNFEAWFNNGSPVGSPTFGTPIELNLNMRGIREIQRLSNGTYVIIAGDPGEGLPSDLYKWTGYSTDAPVLVPSVASGVLKMEGLIQVNTAGNIDLTKLQVLTDGGDVVLYGDGNAAKDLGSPLRKFRSDVLTGLDLNICTGFAATITPSGSTTFCPGGSVSLNVTAGNNNNTYVWSTGATTQSIIASSTNTYSVTVTNITSGCVATATQTVTVQDVIAPVPTVSSLPTITGQCSASATAPTATDNCAGTVTATTTDATTYSTQGTFTIHWTYSDGNGNSSTQNQTLIVNDNIAPIITCPAASNLTTDAGMCTSSASIGTATATDNCSVGSVVATPAGPYGIGTTTVIWTATDVNGNTSTCSQTVIVSDNINPSITSPAAVTTNVTSGCTATGISLGTPTSSDNCGAVTITNNAPTVFPIGNTTVVWTVTDASGNLATASQLVIVVDNISPIINAPAAITMCSLGSTSVSLGTATGTDNCGSVTITNNAPATFPIGITTVIWTADDDHGNTSTASQTVTIRQTPVGSATNTFITDGSSSNVPLTSNVFGTTFAWTSSVTTGTVIGNTDCSSGCGTTINDVLSNVGPVHGVVEYIVTPTSYTGCVGSAFVTDVTVGVNLVLGPISGPSVVCGVTTATYSVAAVLDATTYTWTVPTGITGMTILSGQGTTAITVSISSAIVPSAITVTASNATATSATQSISITRKPAVSGPISGSASTCGLTTTTYSIAPVFGATSYTWNLPSGITIASGAGTTSINVNIASTFAVGNLSVTSVNACGITLGTNIIITGKAPASPGTLSGPANVCGLTTAIYSIPAVAYATGYTWTVPSYMTITSGAGTTSISVIASGTPTTGNISVAATNVCGTGIARTLNLVVAATLPGAITGPATVCGTSTANYTVVSLGTGYTYTWILSMTGWTVTSGQGTTSINVSGPSTGASALGLVKVTSTNSCGNTSGIRTLAVTYCHSAIAGNSTDGEQAHNSFSSLYPNPAVEEFKLDVTSDSEKEITLQVYDVTGNIIINEKHQIATGTTTLNTNIENNKSGLYFVRLVDLNFTTVYSQTIIKQ